MVLCDHGHSPPRPHEEDRCRTGAQQQERSGIRDRKDQRRQQEPCHRPEHAALPDDIRDRRRVPIVGLDEQAAGRVRQEMAIAEIPERLYVRIEVRAVGCRCDETAAASAATPAASSTSAAS